MNRYRLTAFLFLMVLATSAGGQNTFYSIFSFDSYIPQVSINDNSVSLQASLFPNIYRERPAEIDIRWVKEHDSALVTFWKTKGDSTLHILTELSGIEWYESEFDLYLVRQYPSIGSSDPLILPIGGVQRGPLVEVAADGNRLILNLVYQLARRILSQTEKVNDPAYAALAEHPLMRPTPYRRDIMAMLLAVATCQNLIGADSTNEAYRSAFWKKQMPGRTVFETYLLNKWILAPDHTLADWILSEPRKSQLVSVTRPPRRRSPVARGTQIYVEGLPLKGKLGFSVKTDQSNRIIVDKIDTYRLAFASGLREADRIRKVDGQTVRSHRDLIVKILDSFENGGSTLQIVRGGDYIEVVIQSMMLPLWEDDEYLDEYPEDDSLDNDYPEEDYQLYQDSTDNDEFK